MNIFLGAGIRVNIVHFGHRLMLSTLRPGDSFEIILALFDISIDLLFIIELFELLLLHLLLYQLLLFGKC